MGIRVPEGGLEITGWELRGVPDTPRAISILPPGCLDGLQLLGPRVGGSGHATHFFTRDVLPQTRCVSSVPGRGAHVLKGVFGESTASRRPGVRKTTRSKTH